MMRTPKIERPDPMKKVMSENSSMMTEQASMSATSRVYIPEEKTVARDNSNYSELLTNVE